METSMTRLLVVGALALVTAAWLGDAAATYEGRAAYCYVAENARGEAYVVGSGATVEQAQRNAVWPSDAVAAYMVECDAL